jgi:hypothetical protein
MAERMRRALASVRAPRMRQRLAAFAISALANGLIITGIAVSTKVPDLPRARSIQVWLIGPLEPPTRRKPGKTEKRAGESVHARAVATGAPPPPASLAPLPLAPSAAPPPGRWTFDPNAGPAGPRGLGMRDRCARGDTAGLTPQERAACLAKWGHYRLPDDPLRHPELRDPHGEFARAAAEAEEQRRPMQQAPMGECDVGTEGRNLHRVCHSDQKGWLVKRLLDPPQ